MKAYYLILLCVCFLVFGLPSRAYAICFPTGEIPSNFEIITSPVIFYGSFIGHVEANSKTYPRFKIIEGYKGTKNREFFDIPSWAGKWNVKIKSTTAPRVGSIIIPSFKRQKKPDPSVPKINAGKCGMSKHARKKLQHKIQMAYSTPFPTLYLLIDAHKKIDGEDYVLALLYLYYVMLGAGGMLGIYILYRLRK
jgi:hypothetical protein